MIAIMIADLDILQKKHRSFCVIISLWPFQPTVTLSKDLPKEITVVNRQKGAMTWTIFHPKKSRAFSRMKGPAVYPPFPKAVKGLYDNHHHGSLGIFRKKNRPNLNLLGLDPSTPIDQPSSREAFRLPSKRTSSKPEILDGFSGAATFLLKDGGKL